MRLEKNNLGKDSQNMKYLAEGIRESKKLKELSLYLDINDLGNNCDNLKYIKEGIVSKKGELTKLNISFRNNKI